MDKKRQNHVHPQRKLWKRTSEIIFSVDAIFRLGEWMKCLDSMGGIHRSLFPPLWNIQHVAVMFGPEKWWSLDLDELPVSGGTQRWPEYIWSVLTLTFTLNMNPAFASCTSSTLTTTTALLVKYEVINEEKCAQPIFSTSSILNKIKI